MPASGAKTDRAQLLRGLNQLAAGDVLMVTGLDGLAEFERELIRPRIGGGRLRAVARGVKMGQKPKLTVHQAKEAIKRRDRGESLREIAQSYNVSYSTTSQL